MEELLRSILGAERAPLTVHDADQWAAHYDEIARRTPGTVERAFAVGAAMERPAWAFASGYRAALGALVPGGDRETACLCATEEAGAHPRAIRTTLAGGRLHGAKKWATLGMSAHVLWVVAREGEDAEGRVRLRLVRVPADATGVTRRAMPPTPFAPEIVHAEITLRGVLVRDEDVLEGDAWSLYLRPFRTIEDIHVLAALAGWLVATLPPAARAAREDLAALVVTLRALAAAPASSPATHIALTGALRWARACFDAGTAHLSGAPLVWWDRDRALVEVASVARARRADVAWQRLRDQTTGG